MNEFEKRLKEYLQRYQYEVSFADGFAIISKHCSSTNEMYSVTVNAADWLVKESRTKRIQQIWPEMELDKREFLISGITPNEWKDLYEH
jgi:hypothetical protein